MEGSLHSIHSHCWDIILKYTAKHNTVYIAIMIVTEVAACGNAEFLIKLLKHYIYNWFMSYL